MKGTHAVLENNVIFKNLNLLLLMNSIGLELHKGLNCGKKT